MMANEARKIFNDMGILLPNNARTPSANAMSVAIGIPNPACVAVHRLKIKCNKAGVAIPPIAAKTGKVAFFMSDSSPL
jgi:hypothetical protein